MRLFLDANVLFTAVHNPSGKAAFIVELANSGHWEIVTSTLAVEEARHNIASKFPEALQSLENMLVSMTLIKSGSGRNCPIQIAEKDRPIMESAIKIKATHLLTGDLRHFGPFMNKQEKTAGIVIQTVSEFLEGITPS